MFKNTFMNIVLPSVKPDEEALINLAAQIKKKANIVKV